ncbi:uncharacterized protein LAJ45_03651 [Morchella importuna]|uniref:uncharacterized protein n=1 Tax=Morchella importuna TaxID=1174673 RepID=UPI001E8E3278|nr:uncharacterized protein LAJ45_03651 [Morchella importuna]KAH8152225.1 hypothetical protein LAJ45_03651 [Morchella importuna]
MRASLSLHLDAHRTPEGRNVTQPNKPPEAQERESERKVENRSSVASDDLKNAPPVSRKIGVGEDESMAPTVLANVL